VQANLLTATATLLQGESSGGEAGTGNALEGAANLIEELVNRLDDIVPEVIFCISFSTLT
jgi:hypothetical protein